MARPSTRHFAEFISHIVAEYDFAVTAVPTVSFTSTSRTGIDWEAMALVEIDFDDGTRYYSFEGVTAPDRFYEAYVISIGNITREVDPLNGDYTVANVQVTMSNADSYWTTLKATYGFRNRSLRIRFGNKNFGLSAVQTVFQGVITNWEVRNKYIIITARDIAFDKLRSKVGGYLNATDFPNLPSDQERHLLPIIFGEVSSVGYSETGALPAYRVNPAVGQPQYTYLVARHVCKSILNVYIYGVLQSSGYSVRTQDINGTNYQMIDFASDPKDDTRPLEYEVTIDVQGITDDGLQTGTLVTNPVDQMQIYCEDYADYASSDLALSLWADAAIKATADGDVGGWAIIDKETIHADIFRRFSESFGMSLFMTQEGRLGIYRWADSDMDDEASFRSFDENNSNDFVIQSNREVASRLQYNYAYNWARSYFERQPDRIDLAEEANLAGDIRQNRNLWYVRDATTAVNVATLIMAYQTEATCYISFSVPLTRFKTDLNDYVKVTNWQGIASDGLGYQGDVFRVIGVALNLNPQSMSATIRCAKTAIFEISSPSLSVSPSASASATSSATPSATPSASPSATPSPSASSSATPSATPSPSSSISASPSAMGPGEGIIFSRGQTYRLGTTWWSPTWSQYSGYGTESYYQCPVPSDGTFRNFRAVLSAAPGTGAAHVFTLRKNGADTTLTFTITDPDVAGSDLVNEVEVTAGDLITIQCAKTGSPPADLNVRCSLEFESDIGGATIDMATSQWATIYEDGYRVSPTGYALQRQAHRDCAYLFPCAGKIRNLYVKVMTAPGVGSSWDFGFTLNGGTDREFLVNIADNDTTGSETSTEIEVADGDRIDLYFTKNGTPANTELRFGWIFIPNVEGRFVIPCCSSAANIAGNTVNYGPLHAATKAPDTTETTDQDLGSASFTILGCRVWLEEAPGEGHNYTFSLRENEDDASDPFEIVIADLDTEGSTTGSFVPAANSRLNWKSEPDGGATYGRFAISYYATLS